jgi:peptidoglycan hydrolase-like protein with peptidoglycan-binding domain
VKDLQQALKRAGFFVYPDGHYGPATKKAVMEFQRKAGLEPTGRVGSETRARLMKLQTDSVAPWWSSSTTSEAASLPTQRPQPKRNWWETGGDQAAVQPQHGRKAWWDV